MFILMLFKLVLLSIIATTALAAPKPINIDRRQFFTSNAVASAAPAPTTLASTVEGSQGFVSAGLTPTTTVVNGVDSTPLGANASDGVPTASDPQATAPPVSVPGTTIIFGQSASTTATASSADITAPPSNVVPAGSFTGDASSTLIEGTDGTATLSVVQTVFVVLTPSTGAVATTGIEGAGNTPASVSASAPLATSSAVAATPVPGAVSSDGSPSDGDASGTNASAVPASSVTPPPSVLLNPDKNAGVQFSTINNANFN